MFVKYFANNKQKPYKKIPAPRSGILLKREASHIYRALLNNVHYNLSLTIMDVLILMLNKVLQEKIILDYNCLRVYLIYCQILLLYQKISYYCHRQNTSLDLTIKCCLRQEEHSFYLIHSQISSWNSIASFLLICYYIRVYPSYCQRLSLSQRISYYCKILLQFYSENVLDFVIVSILIIILLRKYLVF